VRYLGTSLSLTLGAWRLRLQVALEDAPDEDASATAVDRGQAEAARSPHHLRIEPRTVGRRAS
jgi:hypothetical protein